MHVVDESFKQRKESGTKRNDLLDLMIDAIDGNLEDLDDHDIHSSDQFEKDAKIRLIRCHHGSRSDFILCHALSRNK